MDNKPESSPDTPTASVGIPAPEGEVNLIDTDYKIGQDNYQANPMGVSIDIHGAVFVISSLLVLAFVVLTLALPEQSTSLFDGMKNWINNNMTWFFLLSANIFLILCIVLIFSPLGRVRIGGGNAKPDFSYLGWFSMLFAAGMGVGLMFYGVSEPLTHYGTALGGTSMGEAGARTDWAPLGAAEGNPSAAMSLGMAATIFHWGLHPGRSTPSWPCRWRSFPTTRGCR